MITLNDAVLAATRPFWFQALILALSAFVGTVLLTRAVIYYLHRQGILDQPNQRSSHTQPTPRGGGLGVVPIILGFWLLIWRGLDPSLLQPFALQASMAVLGYCIVLCAISWLDDQNKDGVPAHIRLLVQIVAVVAPVMMLPDHMTIFQGLVPIWLDRILTIFGWLWFVNLFNFMDGINGIAGAQAAMMALGLGLLAALDTGDVAIMLTSGVIFGASLGFLVWNYGAKAKVFLGDIGSIGLGYLLGWILLLTALRGYIVPALVIPLYFLADATITILKRLVRGEKIWQPHRLHFFQQATRAGGLSHPMTVNRTIALNGALLLIALIPSFGLKIPLVLRLLAAVGLTGLVLYRFYEIGRDANKPRRRRQAFRILRHVLWRRHKRAKKGGTT